MSRYIDTDLLLEKFEKQRAGANDQMFKIGMNTAMQIVRYTPTADVEEVRHGYWKMCYYPNDEHVECSECHTQYYENDLYLGGNEFPKRCPECGAKMDKEKE